MKTEHSTSFRTSYLARNCGVSQRTIVQIFLILTLTIRKGGRFLLMQENTEIDSEGGHIKQRFLGLKKNFKILGFIF